ncbi:SprT family zinc-dependent metalloprotease [Silanimonas algicola]
MSPDLRSLFGLELVREAARESLRTDVLLPDGSSVPLHRVRDRRARRLRLTVSERGVRLSVPWRVSERVAHAFVQDHAGWIAAQWQRFRGARAPVAWCFDAVGELPLLGESLPVAWVEARSARLERVDPAGPPDATGAPKGSHLRFHAPRAAAPSALRRALLEFYSVQARAAIHRWLPAYLPGLPRPPREFRVRALSSLWGSLAPDGTVSLDLSLVLGPPSAFEYVLVHELCHLIHANHSAAFWREVEQRCPGWREVRAFLRSDGGLGMKAHLRALTKA